MTEIQRALTRVLERHAAYYQHNLHPDAIAIWLELLTDCGISPDELRDAFRRYETSAATRFPVFGHLFPDRCTPLGSPADQDLDAARAAVARVVQAIGTYGSYDRDGARAWVGELGARLIDDMGWGYMCSTHNAENAGVLNAQWRDHLVSYQRRSRQGIADVPPVLPEPAVRPALPVSRETGLSPVRAILDNITAREAYERAKRGDAE